MIKYIDIPAGMKTAAFAMGENAIEHISEFLQENFPGRKAWIIADGNTWRAAGQKAAEYLPDSYPPKIFPAVPRLHPDSDISDKLAEEIAAMENCLPVAVGSGVINDVVKRASGIAGVTYCCVPTAASVDGYTSNGAAMSVGGFKKTLPCAAPYALLVDTDVLYAAPPEMFSSGYADLFAKIPAGGDWKIADALGIEKIDPAIWSLVQDKLRSQLSDPTDFFSVFAGLAATGYAMQLYFDSRPASGAEHLMSHVWEMEKLTFNGEEVSHGFKVAAGSIALTRLQEFIIRTPREKAEQMASPLLTADERRKEVRELLARDCYGSGVETLAMEKFEGTEQRRKTIFENWERIRVLLREQIIPSAEAAALLKKADAPVEYCEIGLSREDFLHGIRTAQLIRKRYTALDMLYDAGVLECALSELP